jgi:hypothetical protein
MNEQAFLEFVKTAADQGATGEDLSLVIKEATGEEIDPQQLEALIAQMHGHQQVAPHGEHTEEMVPHGHPGAEGHPQEGAGFNLSPEELDALAAEIAQHMQSGDMASHEAGLPPEAQQGLAEAKTASYIGGFLKSARDNGFDLENAINIYGTQYANTVSIMKEACEREADVVKIAATLDDETLAYFQGLGEKSAAMNFTYPETLEILKQAGATDLVVKAFEKEPNN